MKQILLIILAAIILAAPAASAAKKKTVTVTYEVNIHCKKCVEKLTDNLAYLKGVEDLKVSLEDKTVTITYNPAKTNEDTLVQAIKKCGYSAVKREPVPAL